MTSLPAHATVWLDGDYLGATPLTLGAVPTGRHTMTLTKSGWLTQEFLVDARAGAVLLEARRLSPALNVKALPEGTVVIHGRVDEKSIVIDGVPQPAPAAPIPLPAGVHTIVAAVNGEPVARFFTVVPETELMLVMDASVPGHRTSLVEPAARALPLGSLSIEGTKIVIRLKHHIAVGHLQDPNFRIDATTYRLDSPPVMIGNQLYLPVNVLDTLTQP